MDELDKTIAPRREQVGISVADDMTMPGKRDRKPDGRFSVGDLVMNRYKILAELGQGGMGVVYRCLDETAGIEVALKALPPELSHNTIEMEDIKDNFQLVSKLIHQNIAVSKNLERDNSNGNYYLIMECCEGEDLRHWIKRKRKEGDLKLEEILSIVQQVADALDYAHEQKVIHRDIKPGNIMINSSGKIKVLDFGLAAQIHTSMTRVSMAYHGTSGTGPYMAPEQWRGRAQGAAADQYALAVMAYEMLAGHLPFESADPAVLQQAVLTQEAEDIADISKTVQSALKRGMSKDPADRFDSCSDFVAALSGKKVKSAKKSGKGFPKWAAVLLAMILLGAGIGGYCYFDNDKPESIVIGPEKPEPENNLKPSLEIIATVDGERVPATVRFGDQTMETYNKTFRDLTENSSYKGYLTYKRGNAEYVGSVGFTCDWRGVKKLTVALKKLDFQTIDCNGVTLEMVKIPAGSFIMGSPSGEYGRYNNETQHQVTLTRDFYLGKYEVTQAQWKAVMVNNPYPSKFIGDNRPVEKVSWNDAKEFCNKLNDKYAGKLPAGYKFDLPTEAQWEYACRAGTTTAFSYGNASDPNKMNFDGNYPLGGGTEGIYRGETVDVGSLGYQNAFGLYDMHGNVWEWCRDWFADYPNRSVTDPVGPSSGWSRVGRGGSWSDYALSCRSAGRSFWGPDGRDGNLGFRLALVPVQ